MRGNGDEIVGRDARRTHLYARGSRRCGPSTEPDGAVSHVRAPAKLVGGPGCRRLSRGGVNDAATTSERVNLIDPRRRDVRCSIRRGAVQNVHARGRRPRAASHALRTGPARPRPRRASAWSVIPGGTRAGRSINREVPSTF